MRRESMIRAAFVATFALLAGHANAQAPSAQTPSAQTPRPGTGAPSAQAAGAQTAQAPRAPTGAPQQPGAQPQAATANAPQAAPQAGAGDAPDGHAHAGGANAHGGAANGMFEPPPDTTDEDPRLPAGTIAIVILDPDNRPLPHTNVTLGIMHQSVAKGESREHKNAEGNDVGALTFDGLATGTGVAYRVTVVKDGATFAAMPFQLPLAKGMRVALHVYPVTRDITQSLIVMRSIVYAEMKEDRVQLQQVLTVFNAGRVAWIPDNVMLGLPENYTAFSGVQAMSDTGVDPVEKHGVRLHGTFAPGRHDVEFRWQLPYGGDAEVSITETLPPHVAVARVIAAASQKMRLVVEGFPEAESTKDNQGQNLLITERQMSREEPALTRLHFELRDLPVEGPARWLATAFSSAFVFVGIGIALTTRARVRPAAKGARKAEGKAERADLLADLEDLERAHRAGEIGPKTYERARREIIDALARSLAMKGDGKNEPSKAEKPSASKARS